MIQDRLKNKGFFGYLRFLAQKNRHNTANGDFDWGWDGGDLIQKHLLKIVGKNTCGHCIIRKIKKVTIYEFICIFSIYSHY